MKSDMAKPEKAVVAAGQPKNMRPIAKTIGTQVSEMIEVQQAKIVARKKTQDELDQEALLEQLDSQISAREGQESWEVAQAGLVGQLAAGGQAVGAGAGAAGVGSGAAAAAASSGAYVGIAPTAGIFSPPNSGSTSGASSFATTALNLGAGLVVSGLAAAASGGADNDKVPPGASDEVPPTVAMDVLYSVGRTATVRFTFSEEVALLPVYNPGDDPSTVGVEPIGYVPFYMGRESAELTELGNGAANLNVPDGTFTSFVQDPLNPKVWTAVFLPADGLEVCDITIATGNFADIQNNTNTATASISIDFTDPQPYAIGVNWNTSRLTIDYGADKSYLVEIGESVNEFEQYKTDDDDIFAYEFGGGEFGAGEPGTENFSNYKIGYGDRIKNAFYFDGFEPVTTHISVPDTFDESGGADVDGNQFEVYYGIYDGTTGIFTVTGTPETFIPDGSSGNLLFGEELIPTHTLVLYDNDSRFEENFTNTYDNKPFYLEAFVVDGLREERNWVINGEQGGKYLSWEPPVPLPVGGISFANSDNTTINYGEDPSNPDLYTQFLMNADADHDDVVDVFVVDIFANYAYFTLHQYNEVVENEFASSFTRDVLNDMTATLVHNGQETAMTFYLDESSSWLTAAVDQAVYDPAQSNYLVKTDYLSNGIPSQMDVNLPDHIRLSGNGFEYNYYILDDHVPRAEVLEFSYADDQGGSYPTFVHSDGYVYRNIEDVLREAMYFETQSTLDSSDPDYYSQWTGNGYLRSAEDVTLYRWQITDLANPSVVWDGAIIGDQIRFDAGAYGNGNVNQNNDLYQDYKMTGTLITNGSINLSYVFNGDDDTMWVYLPQSEISLGRDLSDFTWTLENLVDDTTWTGVIWEGDQLVNFDARAYGGGSVDGITNETTADFILKGTLISDPTYVIEKIGFGGDFSGTNPYPFIV